MNSSKRLITWGWTLVALIPLTMVAYAVIAYLNASSSQSSSQDLFTQPNPILAILNTIVFIFGAVGAIGLPAGIVMLIVGYSRRKQTVATTVPTTPPEAPAASDTPPPGSL
jgi:hypothetical protein